MKKILLLLLLFNLIHHICFAICTPVTIATQPQNQNDSIPGNAHFNVSVSGTAPFNYYWYVNGVVVDSTVNSALASNTYNTPALTMADSNNTYYCIITNCAGANTVTSNTVHLVCMPVAIVIQPLNQTFTAGNVVTISFSITVTGTPPFTYKWYKNGTILVKTTIDTVGASSVYSFNANPVIFGMNGWNYHCVVSNCHNGVGGGGGGSQAVSANGVITVNCPTMAAPVATANPTNICGASGPALGTYLSTSSVAGATYSWTGSNGFTSSMQNTGVLVANSSLFVFYVFSVTITVNGCTSPPGNTGNVTLFPEASLQNYPQSQTICSGGTINYTAIVNPSPDANATISHSTTSCITGFVPSYYQFGQIHETLYNSGTVNCSVTYTVSPHYAYGWGNNNQCNSSPSTFTVTVKPNPTIVVNSPDICIGQTVALTAGGATTYTWSTGATSSGVGTANATPTSTHTYTVTGTLNGCTNTAASTVTVNTVFPTVTVNSPTICLGETATLVASGADTYTWSAGTTATSTDTAIANPLTTQTYTVTGTLNSCASTAVSNIVVNPLPNVTVNSPSICGTNNDTLIANGALTYVWSAGATPLGNDSAFVNPISNTTYTVTGTDMNGCSNTAISTVTVSSSAPATPSTILGVTHICEGSSTAYGVTNDTTATGYIWTLPPTWTGVSDSCLITATADTSAGIITVVATNGCGQSAPQTLNVYGSEMPVVTVAPLGTVCAYSPAFALTVGSPPGGTYSGQGVNSGVFTPATVAVGTYYVTYTYTQGACTVRDSVPIVVDLCLGLNELIMDNGQLIIAPNPAKGQVIISFQQTQGTSEQLKIKKIKMYNLIGECVYQSAILCLTKEIININQLSKGIYFVSVEADNGEVMKRKLVVE